MDGLEVLERLRGMQRGAAGRRHLRPRHDQHRGRGDQEGRVRLHREAARQRARAGQRCATRSSSAGCATRTGSLKRASKSGTRWSATAPALQQVMDADRARRADQRDRADHGRERRRQGAGGARHPSQQPAQPRALRAGQLRGDPRGADRVGAVRPREGLVHRRHREADRQVRAGRQRHDLPRRGRRHER